MTHRKYFCWFSAYLLLYRNIQVYFFSVTLFFNRPVHDWFNQSCLVVLTVFPRHDIAEILLKLALNTNQSINQSINQAYSVSPRNG